MHPKPRDNKSRVANPGRVRLREKGAQKNNNPGLCGNWLAKNRCIHAVSLRLIASNHVSAMSTIIAPPVGACLTLKEVAYRLQVCRRTLEREILAGRFPRPLKIGRSVRVPESDLQAYIASLRAGAAPQS